MDPIKEAFSKIKQDIFSLFQEIQDLKQDIEQLKVQQNPQNIPQTPYLDPTIPTQTPTQPPIQTDIPTQTPTQTPTHPHRETPIFTPFSTGNRGVPTDRQTNQQTDNYPEKFAQPIKDSAIDEFQQAQDILDSLDSIKKGIRLKFKRLTQQEMLVFSTLYSFEEQNIREITYKLIANNLNLSESSIRDYTNKLINKGIPIIKTRMNNKKIALSVSEDLKNIASLSTINQLRDI